MRNTILVLLAASVLALAGCGRSTSYYDDRMHTGPAPDRPTAAELAQEEADRARREAEQAKRDAEQAKREAAQAKRDAERARQEAEEAKAAQAAAEAAKAKAEAASREALRSQRDAEAALRRAEQSSGDAERARQEVEAARTAQRAAEAARVAAEAAKAKAEAALRDALAELRAAEADRGTQTQTPTRTPTTNPNPPVTAAERSALLKAAFAGLDDEDTHLDAPTVTPKNRAPAVVTGTGVELRSSAAPSGRWHVTTASHFDETRRDSVLVYSDVGAPTLSDPLANYPFDLTPDRRYRAAIVTDTKGTSDYEIPVPGDGSYKTLVDSDRFPSSARTVQFPLTRYFIDPRRPPGTVTTSPENDRTAWFPGTFAGVPGQFQCVGTPGTPCVAERAGDGITLRAGTWTFRAAPDARVSEPDTSYMYFGSWRRLTLPTGPMRYSVFSGSRSDHTPTSANFPALTGTATYTGPAIGYYAYSSNHGRFKATARLDAKFGGEMEPFTISGTVTGFDVNAGWKVTLKEADITAAGPVVVGMDEESNVSWKIGGSTVDGGHWNAKFHYEDAPTTIPGEMHNDYPEGIAGTFSAQHGTTGRMVGAFGAHRPED